jgi:hypothetical protein
VDALSIVTIGAIRKVDSGLMYHPVLVDMIRHGTFFLPSPEDAAEGYGYQITAISALFFRI